jgi:DNA adenine methylase
MNNTSPLRYPGGKTRACKKLDSILEEYFNTQEIKTIVSPFFGGGSFEFFLQNKYNYNLICNDLFKPVYNFWLNCKTNKKKLCKELYKKLESKKGITKEEFMTLRNSIMDETNSLKQAVSYHIINRCSFSGATLSGGFSEEASKKRFTTSSIDKINNLDLSKFEIKNEDCTVVISRINDNNDTMIFLDPPYYLEKGSKLYGMDGDMHDTFDHMALYKALENKRNWMMTYNDNKYIRDLYKNFLILDVDWSYGMNKTKKSSEIVIISV